MCHSPTKQVVGLDQALGIAHIRLISGWVGDRPAQNLRGGGLDTPTFEQFQLVPTCS